MKKLVYLLLVSLVFYSCTNTTNLSGWSEVEKQMFVKSCIIEGGQDLEGYCHCVLEKMIEKYPNSKDVEDKFGDLTLQESLDEFLLTLVDEVVECLNEIPGYSDNILSDSEDGGWSEFEQAIFVQACAGNDKSMELYCKCMMKSIMYDYSATDLEVMSEEKVEAIMIENIDDCIDLIE